MTEEKIKIEEIVGCKGFEIINSYRAFEAFKKEGSEGDVKLIHIMYTFTADSREKVISALKEVIESIMTSVKCTQYFSLYDYVPMRKIILNRRDAYLTQEDNEYIISWRGSVAQIPEGYSLQPTIE